MKRRTFLKLLGASAGVGAVAAAAPQALEGESLRPDDFDDGPAAQTVAVKQSWETSDDPVADIQAAIEMFRPQDRRFVDDAVLFDPVTEPKHDDYVIEVEDRSLYQRLADIEASANADMVLARKRFKARIEKIYGDDLVGLQFFDEAHWLRLKRV